MPLAENMLKIKLQGVCLSPVFRLPRPTIIRWLVLESQLVCGMRVRYMYQD